MVHPPSALHRRPRRERAYRGSRYSVLALPLLFAAAGAGGTPDPSPNVARDADVAISLALPRTSREALSSGSGLAWNQLRQGGLEVSASGSGTISARVAVLVVQNRRIVKRWVSGSFSVGAPSSSSISGRYLPDRSAIGGPAPIRRFESTPRGIDAGRVLGDLESGTVGFVDMGRDTGVIIVLLPGTSSTGTTTNPLFAKSVEMDDI